MRSDQQRADSGRVTQQEVARARDAVLSGRGPGASPEEVLSHSRAKVVQAGLPAVRRLAETARDAARARSAESIYFDGGLVADIEQPPRNTLATVVPRSTHSTTRAGDAGSSLRDRRRSGAVIAMLVLLALLICRRSRQPTGSRTIRCESER